METLTANRRLITFLLGAVLFGAGLYSLRAEDESQADGTKAEEAAAEDKDKAKDENPFAVPETDDPEKLLAFIEDLRAKRPPRPQGPAEYRAFVKYNRNAPAAIAEAAQRVLSQAEKSSTEYADASAYLLETKVMGFAEAEEKEREAILKDVKQHLEKYGVRRDEAGVAYGISQALERENPKLAAQAYKDFAGLIRTSEVEEIRELDHLFEGPARRLNLVGSKMKVFGTTLDGEEFDWDKYRGKVVLIDFWATWCGPCLAELPNLKDAYEKYHDEGFDIVGVNIDQRKFATEQYLAKNPLPWTQLYQEEEGNELAEYYGVNAIPFIVLVGKDGKVISTDARGRRLHEHLEEIFGPADATDDPAASGE